MRESYFQPAFQETEGEKIHSGEVKKVDYSTDGIYGDFTYGAPYVSRGLINAISLTQDLQSRGIKSLNVLIVGAGNGYEIVRFGKAGHNVTGLDLYIPNVPYIKERSVKGSADCMPFSDNQFDLVFCTEMFEHVTEQAAETILTEFQRVAGRFYVTIATKDDPPYNTHINIQPAWWWIKKFEALEFKLANAQQCPVLILQTDNNVTQLNYSTGVTLYGDCKGV